MASSRLHLRGCWLEYGQRGLISQLASLTGYWQEFLVSWQKVFLSHGRVLDFPQLVKGLLQRLLCYDTISEDTHCHLFPHIIYWEQVTSKNCALSLKGHMKTTLLPHFL